MRRLLRRAARTALMLLGIALPLAPVSAQEKEGGAGKPAVVPDHVTRDRLPVLGTVGDLPPEGERVVVEVFPAPALRVGGVLLNIEGFVQVLGRRSEGHREEAPPGASRIHVVIRADRDVRWQDVQWVMQACADPRAKVCRVLFAAVPEDGGDEGAMATFLPHAASFLPNAAGAGSAGAEVSGVTLDVKMRSVAQPGPAPAFALYAALERGWGPKKAGVSAGEIDADPDVSVGTVLEAVDVLLRWGVKGIVFRGAGVKGAIPPVHRLEPVVTRPRIILLDKAVGAPDADAPVLARVARVTGRLAGQTESPSLSHEPGPAKGLFGGRRGGHGLVQYEGGAGTEAAVEAGLQWLANHQSPEGWWDCDGFEGRCKGDKCGGPGFLAHDPGVTGLAMTAFLAYGETHKTPRWGPVVRAGIKYLRGLQNTEGAFGAVTTEPRALPGDDPLDPGPMKATRVIHPIYNHALCTLAYVELYGLTGSPLFKPGAQSAVNFALKCRNPYLAWRYGVQPQDNDTSVTAWMVLALKAASEVGLDLDPEAFSGANDWMNKVTDPEFGRTGYTSAGNGPDRPQVLMDTFPAERSEATTAMALLTRFICGAPRDNLAVVKGASLCMKCLPAWEKGTGRIDFCYWHFGSLAMFQMGGDSWTTWNEAMKKALVSGQRQDAGGCARGSWDPCDPWGADGGRIYSTAMGTLCLETYYRYPRGLGAKK